MTDVAPSVADHLLGDPLEQERERRQRDVGPDPALGTMIDRSKPESALHLPPRLLDPLQLPVAESHAIGTQRVVVGVHDELPVQSLGRVHPGPADRRCLTWAPEPAHSRPPNRTVGTVDTVGVHDVEHVVHPGDRLVRLQPGKAQLIAAGTAAGNGHARIANRWRAAERTLPGGTSGRRGSGIGHPLCTLPPKRCPPPTLLDPVADVLGDERPLPPA